MAVTDRLRELAGELEQIDDRLAEHAMDLLRDALRDGSTSAAAAATQRERLVNRARSSVAKAARLLEQAAAAGGGDGS
ncbi:MAG: hypothetical protein M0T79_12085, partial [Actinomycetota bacterium]|nr:hypothetical protein [Actinomycetota bacterium]